MQISGPGIEAAFAFASITTAPASKLAGDPEEAA
jgi:hypothetical protein